MAPTIAATPISKRKPKVRPARAPRSQGQQPRPPEAAGRRPGARQGGARDPVVRAQSGVEEGPAALPYPDAQRGPAARRHGAAGSTILHLGGESIPVADVYGAADGVR